MDLLLIKDFSTGHARINSSVYSELGATYAREIDDKLWLGLRLKYLLGGLNITTNKFTLSLSGIESDNTLEIGAEADIRVSGPKDLLLDAYDLVDEISVDSNKSFNRQSGLCVRSGTCLYCQSKACIRCCCYGYWRITMEK